jgi:predicted ester cyclase
MSTETNKAIVRRMSEQVWNAHQVDLVDEFFTEDIVYHPSNFPSFSGLEAMKKYVAIVLNAYPDIQGFGEDVIAEGDKVVVRGSKKCTHQGELVGIPPTGKQVTTTMTAIYRLVNGKIAEVWFWNEDLSEFQQLGVIPALVPAG